MSFLGIFGDGDKAIGGTVLGGLTGASAGFLMGGPVGAAVGFGIGAIQGNVQGNQVDMQEDFFADQDARIRQTNEQATVRDTKQAARVIEQSAAGLTLRAAREHELSAEASLDAAAKKRKHTPYQLATKDGPAKVSGQITRAFFDPRAEYGKGKTAGKA
ncbi:MAG: hypothetical protein HYV03_03125 [Deltaproteobacteria bacterium]|nr:hypothetical protein [Deltaproteobacteria bacterium]